MVRKLLFSGLAIIGLLAGVHKGSAEIVFACKNNTTGALNFYAASTTCQSGWTLIQMNLGGGALAGTVYECNTGQLINANNPLTYPFSYFSNGSFGSAITAIGTSPFSSFQLQQGIYQIQLSGTRFDTGDLSSNTYPIITAILNPAVTVNAPFWETTRSVGAVAGTNFFRFAPTPLWISSLTSMSE
jgi:hypothetical protein